MNNSWRLRCGNDSKRRETIAKYRVDKMRVKRVSQTRPVDETHRLPRTTHHANQARPRRELLHRLREKRVEQMVYRFGARRDFKALNLPDIERSARLSEVFIGDPHFLSRLKCGPMRLVVLRAQDQDQDLFTLAAAHTVHTNYG